MAAWDAIAESFDLTRKKPWPLVIDFLTHISQTDIIIDLGCGNGRHLLPAAKHCSQAVGVDFSRKLLTLTEGKVRQQHIQNVYLIQADLTVLPFCTETVDTILFIASLHNIKRRKNRIKALQEVSRILKPDGRALITVWSRWQDVYRWHFLKQLFRHQGEYGDIEINWTQHRLNVPRFYHLYSKGELQTDLETADLSVESIKKVSLGHRSSPDNYAAVVKKK
jgi:tRNA (uracil-5-)-methyltransferase TRM9